MSETQEEYAARIKEMSDADFLKHAETIIWLSAFAANNPRAPAHWQTDLVWVEAKNRPGNLYQQAYDRAVRSAGHYELASDRPA